MDRKQEKEDFDRDSNEFRSEGLKRLYEKAEIKSLIALIHPSEAAPEALRSLIEAAFNSGYGSGQAQIMLHILERQFSKAE